MERLLAYEASAGTGKTFALVVRYISLLFLGAKPESILALTFTNKAANEMKVRVLDRLKNLRDSEELKYISQNTGLDEEKILKLQPKIYKNFLSADIKILTIDSFFSNILRKFSMQAGLTPDFLISSTFDTQNLYHKFLYFSYKQKKENELIKISILQEKRLKDIFTLLQELYKNMINIDNNLDLRDYNKYKEAAKKEFLKIKNFINSCEKASKSALNAVNKIENVDDILAQTWFAKESLGDFKFFKKCYKEEIDVAFHKLKSFIKIYLQIKESLILNSLNELFLIYKETNRLIKKESNQLTFDDILNFVFYILNERVDRDFLYFRLDSKIDHILIDEFQDTSLIQYKILEPFIEEIASGFGQKEIKTFFYVGDVKQSIYRFRGGFKELFSYVAQKFGIKTVPMDINYRSDRYIVEFVNDTFAPYYDNFTIQKPNSEKEGYVEVKKSEEILDDLVESVKVLLGNGVDEKDIAILCFKNEDILKVEEIIKKSLHNVKVVTETSSKLINQKEIIGLIEILKYIYFRKDIFKENFISAFNLKDIQNIEYDEYQTDISKLVKKILKDFKLPVNENILKFLEIVQRYETLGDFIFDYERIDESIVSSKQEGIRVLTIHKSKGLEFNHVIVLDRLSKKGGDTSLMIYDYERIDLKRVFIKKSGREIVDDEYKEALEKENRLKKEDIINSLYVAFTRAKNSLIVLKNSKNSAFNEISLQEIKIGKIQKSESEKREKNREVLNFEERFYGLQNISQRSEREIFSKEITFGNALHYSLEISDLNDAKSIDTAIDAAKNRYGKYLDDEDFADIKNRVKKFIGNEKTKILLKGAKIYKEIPLSYNNEIKQIDLLIERDLKNIVVDYKSSKEGVYSHKKQVREYIKAVKDITKKETFGYICYLLKDNIEFVEV